MVHGRAGQSALLADGGVGGLDHLRGYVLQGNVADVPGHVTKPADALLEHTLGRLARGAAGAVPQRDHAVQGHLDLGLLDGLLLGLDLGVQAAVVVALGDELVAQLPGLRLGALGALLHADALLDGLALLVEQGVSQLVGLLHRVADGDAPALGVVAAAVRLQHLCYASVSVSHWFTSSLLIRGVS